MALARKKRPYPYEGRSSNLKARLRRIEGQVRGVERMLDEGRYCVEILTQIRAIVAALSRVEDAILNDHLCHCVADALRGADERAKREKIEEVIDLVQKFRQS